MNRAVFYTTSTLRLLRKPFRRRFFADMKRTGFQSSIVLGLLFAGLTGLAIGGVQAVIDLDSGGLFTNQSGTFSMRAIMGITMGGIGLIAGIFLLLAADKKP